MGKAHPVGGGPTRGALSRDRGGGGKCFELELFFTTNGLSAIFGIHPTQLEAPGDNTRFLQLCTWLDFIKTLVFRRAATDAAHFSLAA